jgi:hypothetical protein
MRGSEVPPSLRAIPRQPQSSPAHRADLTRPAASPDFPAHEADHPIVRKEPFHGEGWLFELKLDGFRGIADTIQGRMLSKNAARLPRGPAPAEGAHPVMLPHRVSTANLLPIHRPNWGTCVMTRLHQGWFMSAALLLVALLVLAGIGVTVAEALRSVRPASRVNAVFDADYVQGLATRGIVKVPGR